MRVRPARVVVGPAQWRQGPSKDYVWSETQAVANLFV